MVGLSRAREQVRRGAHVQDTRAAQPLGTHASDRRARASVGTEGRPRGAWASALALLFQPAPCWPEQHLLPERTCSWGCLQVAASQHPFAQTCPWGAGGRDSTVTLLQVESKLTELSTICIKKLLLKFALRGKALCPCRVSEAGWSPCARPPGPQAPHLHGSAACPCGSCREWVGLGWCLPGGLGPAVDPRGAIVPAGGATKRRHQGLASWCALADMSGGCLSPPRGPSGAHRLAGSGHLHPCVWGAGERPANCHVLVPAGPWS